MNAARFRIAWVMVAVAVAALDFGAIRALLPRHENVLDDQRGMWLLHGALPMANALVIGMLIGRCRPARRPFFMGFVVFGAVALAFFIVLATFFSREVVLPYLEFVLPYIEPFVAPIERSIGPGRPIVHIPIVASVLAVLLLGPQVVFAVVGGVLSRSFKVTVTPR